MTVVFTAACGRTVTLARHEVPRLALLVDRPKVQVHATSGEEVSIGRRTRLTLFIDGMEPLPTRPEELGFAEESLRLNELDVNPGPEIEYDRILRVEVGVPGGASNLGWIIPTAVGGVALALLALYLVLAVLSGGADIR